jgi:hypothetical protein
VTRFLGFDIVCRSAWRRLQRPLGHRRRQVRHVPRHLEGHDQPRVDKRNDLSGEPYDLYTSMSYGATRLEPGRLLEVLCSDTTGADITP